MQIVYYCLQLISLLCATVGAGLAALTPASGEAGWRSLFELVATKSENGHFPFFLRSFLSWTLFVHFSIALVDSLISNHLTSNYFPFNRMFSVASVLLPYSVCFPLFNLLNKANDIYNRLSQSFAQLSQTFAS